MPYINCCMLVFIQGSSVSSLALLFVSLSNRTEVAYGARIYFVFCAGANPNALWANWAGFVSSLASLWMERGLLWACQCAYK
jgi:hypothetical protein